MISFYEKKFNLFNDLNFKSYKKNVKSILLKCGGAYVTTIGVACASNDVNNNMTLGELKNPLVETTFFNEPMPTKKLLHNCKQVIIERWDEYNLSTLLENVPLAQEVDVKNFLEILRTDPNVQKLSEFNSENFEEEDFFRAIDLICKKTAEKQYETFQQLQSELIDNEKELKLLYSNKKTIKAVRTEKHNKKLMRPSIKIMSLITSIYNNLREHKFFSEYDFIEIINTYNNNLPEDFKNHYRLECNVESAHSDFLKLSLLTVSFSEMNKFEDLVKLKDAEINQYFIFYSYDKQLQKLYKDSEENLFAYDVVEGAGAVSHRFMYEKNFSAPSLEKKETPIREELLIEEESNCEQYKVETSNYYLYAKVETKKESTDYKSNQDLEMELSKLNLDYLFCDFLSEDQIAHRIEFIKDSVDQLLEVFTDKKILSKIKNK